MGDRLRKITFHSLNLDTVWLFPFFTDTDLKNEVLLETKQRTEFRNKRSISLAFFRMKRPITYFKRFLNDKNWRFKQSIYWANSYTYCALLAYIDKQPLVTPVTRKRLLHTLENPLLWLFYSQGMELLFHGLIFCHEPGSWVLLR